MSRSSPGKVRATPVSTRCAVGLFVSLACVTLLLGACQKSKQKQATEVIEDRVKVCRTTESTLHTVDLFGGDEKKVLQSTCEKEIGEVEMSDRFTGESKVGPYTWKAGLDEATGTWVLKAAEWRAFDRAQRILEGDGDLSAGDLKRASEHLATAIEEYPESDWLRTRRLEVLLDHRAKQRDLTADSGVELGDSIDEHLKETIQWANKNGKTDLAVGARMKIVRYYEDLASTAEQKRKNVPEPNEETIEIEKLKGAIEASKKQGNEKQVEQYKKQLEQIRKERPKKKKHYKQMTTKANTQRCAALAQISLSGIKDKDLKSDVDTAKRSTDCEALLSGSNSETDGSDSN